MVGGGHGNSRGSIENAGEERSGIGPSIALGGASRKVYQDRGMKRA
jgi:hypothetical protein